MKTKKPTSPKSRTQTAYPFYGLGFPVVIRNVSLMEIDGEWVPDIDYNRLENHFAHAVPLKPSPLTGHEVRFLRRHLGWTLDELARKMGVTRQGAIKWEKAADAPTRMEPAAEKLFRLLVLNALGVPAGVFQKAFDRLFEEPRPARDYEIDLRRPPRQGYRAALDYLDKGN